ncbi:hypothetical protein P153DRAFT_82543 [Dothidotthia symphoricarpi CBS 119687]|uniref:Uncharacterized protein n=1 Tax=Dothidotthia symphoricarpi CBS 119687 TaxID=1392245 RepID=A0A6A6A4E8_9PLEO|nr:uncharacterized protein P153DRAFT_82543 [Dothidotthia symphoricarpi CBS 119687]KAF2126680.1 hypothetical protein P153DRAFT_82543 [Dothidotthia symphoricarpi CBS 119687]
MQNTFGNIQLPIGMLFIACCFARINLSRQTQLISALQQRKLSVDLTTSGCWYSLLVTLHFRESWRICNTRLLALLRRSLHESKHLQSSYVAEHTMLSNISPRSCTLDFQNMPADANTSPCYPLRLVLYQHGYCVLLGFWFVDSEAALLDLLRFELLAFGWVPTVFSVRFACPDVDELARP